MLFSVCSVQCSVFSVQFSVCSVQCSVFSEQGGFYSDKIAVPCSAAHISVQCSVQCIFLQCAGEEIQFSCHSLSHNKGAGQQATGTRKEEQARGVVYEILLKN